MRGMARFPAMGLGERMPAGLAAQLGKPTGLRGRLVGNMLNRSNRGTTAAAIEALELKPGATAADLGFGGGVGLELLVERVGPQGHVHGVELSPTMVGPASGRFRRQIASGRMPLHPGSITHLPPKDGSLDCATPVN